MVSSIPMVCFGFMDNFIMIIAGDAIDTSIGAKLGISTMAAAALGNTLSDSVGLFTGDFVEDLCRKAGVNEPEMTEDQARSRATKMAKSGGALIGLASGCLLGMVPLFWKEDRKELYFTPEEEEWYDSHFRPYGVPLHAFFSLMREGKWHASEEGELMAAHGEPLTKVIMLVAGSATADIPGEEDKRLFYLSQDSETDFAGGDPSALRGCFLGVAGLLDKTGKTFDQPFPYEVRAMSAHVRYMSWDARKLQKLMDEDKALHSALLSIVYAQLLDSTRRRSSSSTTSSKPAAAAPEVATGDTSSRRVGASQSQAAETQRCSVAADVHDLALKGYRLIFEMAAADGFINSGEKKFLDDFRKRRGITQEDHLQILKEFGWTPEGWESGSMGGGSKEGLAHEVEDMLQRIPNLLQAAGIKSFF